jgi:hypothetical protein
VESLEPSLVGGSHGVSILVLVSNNVTFYKLQVLGFPPFFRHELCQYSISFKVAKFI